MLELLLDQNCFASQDKRAVALFPVLFVVFVCYIQKH